MPNSPTQAGSVPFWGQYSGTVPAANNPDNIYVGYDENGRIDPNIEDFNLNPWDTAKIAGIQVPGMVRVEVKKEMDRNKKKGVGQHFASVTLLGFDLAEVVMTVRMWTADQFTRYQQLVRQLQDQLMKAITPLDQTYGSQMVFKVTATQTYANGQTVTSTTTTKPQNPGSGIPGPSAAAVDVQHPALAIFGINSLYIRQMVPPIPSSPQGVFEARFLFEEFRIPVQGQPTTIKSAQGGLSNVPTAFDKTQSVPPEQTSASNP